MMTKALTVSVFALVVAACTGQSGQDPSTSDSQTLITSGIELVQCSDPPPVEVSAVSPSEMSIVPANVRAGESAAVIVAAPTSSSDTLMGIDLDWLCWNGSKWVMTHILITDDIARGPETLPHPPPPGVTTIVESLGVLLPSSSGVLIPDVDPGIYRLETGRPVGGVTPFVILEVVP